MKIFIRILSLFTLLTLFPACEKVLDQVPVSQISQGNYWKTPEDAEAGLTACYDGLQDALSANYVHWGEARADAVVGEGGASAVANIQALVRNTLDASNPFANWSGLYRGIARTNSVLAYVPDIQEMPEPRKGQLLAEAHFLRALFYFYAVRLWGDVPYIDRPYASSEVDFNVARTPRCSGA